MQSVNLFVKIFLIDSVLYIYPNKDKSRIFLMNKLSVYVKTL